jgi:hypothetical protein
MIWPARNCDRDLGVTLQTASVVRSSQERSTDIAIRTRPEDFDGLRSSRQRGERGTDSYGAWKSNGPLRVPSSRVDVVIPPGVTHVSIDPNPKTSCRCGVRETVTSGESARTELGMAMPNEGCHLPSKKAVATELSPGTQKTSMLFGVRARAVRGELARTELGAAIPNEECHLPSKEAVATELSPGNQKTSILPGVRAMATRGELARTVLGAAMPNEGCHLPSKNVEASRPVAAGERLGNRFGPVSARRRWGR